MNSATSHCGNCSTLYNQMEHHIVMLPCGDFICLTCFSLLYDLSSNLLTCPFDKEELVIPTKLRENVQILKMKSNTLWVSCDNHQENQAKCFCKQHKQLVCHECALISHSDHKQLLSDVKMSDVESYFSNAQEKLAKFKSQIEEVQDYINMFQRREKSFSSSQFMKIIDQVQDILLPHLNEKEEKQSISFMSDSEQISQPNQSQNPLQIIHQQQSLIQPQTSSALNSQRQSLHQQQIVNTNHQSQGRQTPTPKQQFQQPMFQPQQQMFQEFDFVMHPTGQLEEQTKKRFKIENSELKLLKDWIAGGAELQFELLYRGTRDGFTSSIFHSRCDQQAPTLTFIASDKDKVFGGYTSIPWTQSPKLYQDDKAFIFSLTNKTKLKPYQNFQQAVIHDKSQLVYFGADLKIQNECNINYDSASFLGTTYATPNNLVPKSPEATSFLAGSQYFKVIEIEVYKVQVQ
ncbi:tldc domain-containing protein [Stylonychia lemnae]|uniref:Tldc domain-containing protein n=1 Tax=Stylonychia lemnae TaxID=5949 RepID=A0A078ARY2_STYLE|nr:tldc domain-containing protein [Stylonychia lemnae]|eukprot:CDW83643.1 tldc domain-containing protein [Stylonychia lemnae]